MVQAGSMPRVHRARQRRRRALCRPSASSVRCCCSGKERVGGWEPPAPLQPEGELNGSQRVSPPLSRRRTTTTRPQILLSLLLLARLLGERAPGPLDLRMWPDRKIMIVADDIAFLSVPERQHLSKPCQAKGGGN